MRFFRWKRHESVAPAEPASQETNTEPAVEQTPDQRVDVEPCWEGLAVSVAGSRHIARREGCSDSSVFESLDNETSIAVISDGAGSALHASVASAWAVDACFRRIRQRFEDMGREHADWRSILLDATLYARQSLEQLAAYYGWSFRDCSTTLCIAVATEEAVLCTNLGDAAVAVLDKHGVWSVVSSPENGEYANVTYFLTSRNYLDHVRYDKWDGEAICLAAFTDGLGTIAMGPKEEPRTAFLQPILEYCRAKFPTLCRDQIVSMLQSEKICSKTDDDKTLAMIWRNT